MATDQIPNAPGASAERIGESDASALVHDFLDALERAGDESVSDSWWYGTEERAGAGHKLETLLREDAILLSGDDYFLLWSGLTSVSYVPKPILEALLTNALENALPEMKTAQVLTVLLKSDIPEREIVEQIRQEMSLRLGLLELEPPAGGDGAEEHSSRSFGREVTADPILRARFGVGALVGFSQQACVTSGLDDYVDLIEGQIDSLGMVELSSLVLAVANLTARASISSGASISAGEEGRPGVSIDAVSVIFAKLSEFTDSMPSRHIANVFLAMATLDEFPTNLICRLEKRLLSNLNASGNEVAQGSDEMADEDALTLLWSMCAMNYKSPNVLKPLLRRLFHVESGSDAALEKRMKYTREVEMQVHQVALTLQDKDIHDQVFVGQDAKLWDFLYRPDVVSTEQMALDDSEGYETSVVASGGSVFGSGKTASALSPEASGERTAAAASADRSRQEQCQRNLAEAVSLVLRDMETNLDIQIEHGKRLLDGGFYFGDLTVKINRLRERVSDDELCPDRARNGRVVFLWGSEGRAMDPWQRLKARHLRSAGNDVIFVSQPYWQSLETEDRRAHVRELLSTCAEIGAS